MFVSLFAIRCFVLSLHVGIVVFGCLHILLNKIRKYWKPARCTPFHSGAYMGMIAVHSEWFKNLIDERVSYMCVNDIFGTLLLFLYIIVS